MSWVPQRSGNPAAGLAAKACPGQEAAGAGGILELGCPPGGILELG
jgi:hypothetical protein